MGKKCVFVQKCLVYRAEIKGSETFFRLILSQKIDFPRKQYTSLPLVTIKCCCLPRRLGKRVKFVTCFVYTTDEIPAIFSNLELVADRASELGHAYDVLPF